MAESGGSSSASGSSESQKRLDEEMLQLSLSSGEWVSDGSWQAIGCRVRILLLLARPTDHPSEMSGLGYWLSMVVPSLKQLLGHDLGCHICSQKDVDSSWVRW